MSIILDYVGQRFGKLLVIEKTRKDNMIAWLCKCDCGNEKIVKSNQLSQGKTKSCGCLRRDLFKKPLGHASMTKVIYSIKRGARIRGYEFCITDEEIKEIISQDCFYCGAKPKEKKPCNKRRWTNGNVFVNGIDRIDNTKGYIKENCIPCCGQCNRMKMDMKYEDFINKIKQIHSRIENFGNTTV